MLDPRVEAAYARLTPDQRARLSLALANRQTLAHNGIARLDRTGPEQLFPVSSGQHRLWFLDQLHSGSTAYLVPASVELCGPLDQAALATALNRLVARHESLRTTFPATAGRPSARIAPPEPLRLAVRDVGVEQIREACQGEANRPFDLARGPLLRATLLRVSGDRHVLLLTTHHIVVDGWSLGLLLDELAALYTEAATGARAYLPDLTVQYVDFAAWQETWLRGPVAQEHCGYWRRALRGVPPMTLPVDQPIGAEAAAIAVSWPKDLVAGLQEVARQQRATLFMALTAGLAATLSRWCGQRDVVIGTPVAGRPLPEVEPVAGFFANTLPLRITIEGQPSYRALLSHMRQACLDGFAHQDVPYQNVIEMLPPERRSAPLVQVMLALGNLPTEIALRPDLTLRVLPTAVTGAKFGLTWEIAPDEAGGLAGRLEYDPGLFAPGTVDDLHQSLCKVLGEAVLEPDRPLDLPAPAPAPVMPAVAPTAGGVPPRDAIERLLARIWTDVLEVDHVGVLDDFFVMGGHSLLVTTAVALVQEALGLPVPLEGALGATTIREFAVYLRELGDQAGIDVARLAEGGTSMAVPGPRALDRQLFRAAG